jgi:hypothetical protein
MESIIDRVLSEIAVFANYQFPLRQNLTNPAVWGRMLPG